MHLNSVHRLCRVKAVCRPNEFQIQSVSTCVHPARIGMTRPLTTWGNQKKVLKELYHFTITSVYQCYQMYGPGPLECIHNSLLHMHLQQLRDAACSYSTYRIARLHSLRIWRTCVEMEGHTSWVEAYSKASIFSAKVAIPLSEPCPTSSAPASCWNKTQIQTRTLLFTYWPTFRTHSCKPAKMLRCTQVITASHAHHWGAASAAVDHCPAETLLWLQVPVGLFKGLRRPTLVIWGEALHQCV